MWDLDVTRAAGCSVGVGWVPCPPDPVEVASHDHVAMHTHCCKRLCTPIRTPICTPIASLDDDVAVCLGAIAPSWSHGGWGG